MASLSFRHFFLGLVCFAYLIWSFESLPDIVLGGIAPELAVWSLPGNLARAWVIGAILLLYGAGSASFRAWGGGVRGVFWSCVIVGIPCFVYSVVLFYLSPATMASDQGHMLWMAKTFQITDKYSYVINTFVLAGLSLSSDVFGVHLLLFAVTCAGLLYLLAAARRAGVALLVIVAIGGATVISPIALFYFAYANRDACFAALFIAFAGLIAWRIANYGAPERLLSDVGLGALGGMLLVARPEAFIMLPFFVLAIWMSVFRGVSRLVAVCGMLFVAAFWTGGVERLSDRYNPEPGYRISAILNPLSEVLVSGQIVSRDLEGDLAVLDAVINVELAKQVHNYANIPLMFHPEGIRSNVSKEELAHFEDTAIRMIANNLPEFFANRVKVYVAANGFSQSLKFPYFATTEDLVDNLKGLDVYPDGVREEKIAAAVSTFAYVQKFDSLTGAPGWLIWNQILPLFVSLLVLIYARRAPVARVLAIANLARCGIVFLTAPATFAFYYSTLHTGVWAILVVAIVETLVRNRATLKKSESGTVARGGGLDAGMFVKPASFALLALVGWVLDFSVFSALTGAANVPPGAANFFSSCLGATFAFSAFGLITRRLGSAVSLSHALSYAAFQIVSISVYSVAISLVSHHFSLGLFDVHKLGDTDLLAKIFATPFNFVTNYIASLTILGFLTASARQPLVIERSTGTTVSGARPRTLVFVPAYRCEQQIKRVIAQFDSLPPDCIDAVLIIDNQSPDNTLQVAIDTVNASERPVEIKVWRNADNYGLGGSHKVAFQFAIDNGFDYLVVLHGDDQGAINDLLPYIRCGEAYSWDCFLGARFAPGAHTPGYSRLRILGNVAYNFLFSLVTRKQILDLGAGLNMYRVSALDMNIIRRFPDDLTFNYVMLMWSIWRKHAVRFFAISWREDDQASNVKLFRQAIKVLRLLGMRALSPADFFEQDHRARDIEIYEGDIVARQKALGSCG